LELKLRLGEKSRIANGFSRIVLVTSKTTTNVAFLVVLVILYIPFFFCCLKALVIYGGILKEHDDNLNDGKKDKRAGEPKLSSREPSQRDCLMHEPLRLIRQMFGLFSGFFCKLFLCARNVCKFVNLFCEPVILKAQHLSKNCFRYVVGLCSRM
jgi:hypothetical protein